MGVPIQQINLDPTKSDRCFWDHHPFTGPGVQCPIAYDHRKKTYKMAGWFCSDSCAVTWGEQASGMEQVKKNCGFWSYMRTKKSIRRAPHWDQLQIYGGHLTIEEFRNRPDHITFLRSEQEIPYMWDFYQPRDREKKEEKKQSMKIWTLDKAKPIPKQIVMAPPSRQQRIQSVLQQFKAKSANTLDRNK
jgi:hypothetical protein